MSPIINEWQNIILGIFFLFGMHSTAIFAIFILGLIVAQIFGTYIFGDYTLIVVLAIGGYGFFILQLLYVIPVCLYLRRRQRFALMKGVIIGAVITALLNGGCSLFFYFQSIN